MKLVKHLGFLVMLVTWCWLAPHVLSSEVRSQRLQKRQQFPIFGFPYLHQNSPQMEGMQGRMMSIMESMIQEKMMEKFKTDLEQKMSQGSPESSNMRPNPNGGFTMNIGNKAPAQPTISSPPHLSSLSSPTTNGQTSELSWNPPVQKLLYPTLTPQNNAVSALPTQDQPKQPSSGFVQVPSLATGSTRSSATGIPPIMQVQETPQVIDKVPWGNEKEEGNQPSVPWKTATIPGSPMSQQAAPKLVGTPPRSVDFRAAQSTLPKGPLSDTSGNDDNPKDRQPRMLSPGGGTGKTRYHYF